VDDIKVETNLGFGPMGCIDIFVEADYSVYQSFGGNFGGVIGYVTPIYFYAETFFNLEGISIQFSQLVVWTIPDPYTAYGYCDDVLEAFRQTRTSFNGNLAHLMSTRDIGGGAAYNDVLCSTTHNYAVSGNLSGIIAPTSTTDIITFARELGHNFGSPLTHECAWNGNNTAIDGCGYDPNDSDTCPGTIPQNGGTIMSHCDLLSVGINLNLGFGQQPGALMSLNYSNANCYNDCGSATDYCPSDVIASNAPGSNQRERAFNTITASNVLNSNMIAEYDAGEHIDFVDGFHAQFGVDFHAYIEGCGQSLTGNGSDYTSFGFNNTKEDNYVFAPISGQVTLRNYPNPFSGLTTIEYSLPQNQNVSLRISDLSGRIISNLIEDVMREAGIHTVQFKADQLAPGVYFCTLITSNTVKTHKITLIE